MITVATFNSPHRLMPHAAAFQRLADRGCVIICAQENADNDPQRNMPDGWRYYRPARARSTAVYWNPHAVDHTAHGHATVSSAGFREHRGLTWVQFDTPDGLMRIASAHPPAFKTSRRSHAIEYRKQIRLMAEWLRNSPDRVLAGDINGRIPSLWTRPLSRAGRWSRPVPSGPNGARIDYIGVNKHGLWQIHRTLLDQKRSSDHRAVIAQLVPR